MRLVDTVNDEVNGLHRFFIDWFTGAAEDNDRVFFDGFSRRFDDQFILIPPGGQVLNLTDIAASIRTGHGTNPAFRIAIRNVQVRRSWDNLVLATYEEWQRNAINSSPPDNARVASVLFATHPELRWLHIQETWLPQSIVDADAFAF